MAFVHDHAPAPHRPTSNARPQPDVYKLAFGRFAFPAFMQSGRSPISFSLLSNLPVLPIRARGEFQSEFLSWHHCRSQPHTLAQLYLSTSIMPISPPTLPSRVSALQWLAAGRTGQMAVTSCRPAARRPARGSLCGECECRRTRHCSERGSELSQATDDDRVISVVAVDVPRRL